MKLTGKQVPIAFFVFLSALTSYFSLIEYSGINSFIGHGDQANIANLAQNIVRGNGFVVDTVWIHTNGGLPGNDVTHPEPYWSIYVAALVSVFFSFLGETRVAFVTPALLMKICVVALVSYWCWRITNRKAVPTVTLMTIASFSPNLLNSVNGLSDIYLTAGILACLTCFSFAGRSQAKLLFVISGIFCGLSIGIKPSGVLLFAILPVFLMLSRFTTGAWIRCILFTGASVVALTPYLYYNKVSYGTWMAAGNSYVTSAADISYSLGERGLPNAHNLAFYSPEYFELPPSTSTEKLRKMTARMKDFVAQGFLRSRLLNEWFAPFVLTGLLIVIAGVSKAPSNILSEEVHVISIYGITMLGAGALLACFIHFEARYWLFFTPIFIIIAAFSIRRLHYMFIPPLIAFALAGAVQYHKALQWKSAPEGYEIAQEILPPDAVVFNSNPWQFSFHTGISSVMTPVTDNWSSIMEMAERYSVEYIVVVDGDPLRHSIYDLSQVSYRDLALVEVYSDSFVSIFQLGL